MNQEDRERYGNEDAKGATVISQGNVEFVGADDVFEAARAEESVARARLQRAWNLDMHATGTATEREEDESEENAARNHMQTARKPLEQATGEVKTIFGGVNGWGNESAPPSAPRKLDITGGAAVMMKQQATMLSAGGIVPMAGETAQNLHRALMGVTPTLHKTVMGGNEMGGTTWIAAAPPEK